MPPVTLLCLPETYLRQKIWLSQASQSHVERLAAPYDPKDGHVDLATRVGHRVPSSMKNMTCIEDLRRASRRRVPRAFFDYVEAGSYLGETLRANRVDLEKIKLRQRVLVDVSERDTSTTILEEKVTLPIALAP